MEKYFVALTKGELICLKQALFIAHSKLNYKAEHVYRLTNSTREEIYKKEAIKMEKLLDKLNNLK